MITSRSGHRLHDVENMSFLLFQFRKDEGQFSTMSMQQRTDQRILKQLFICFGGVNGIFAQDLFQLEQKWKWKITHCMSGLHITICGYVIWQDKTSNWSNSRSKGFSLTERSKPIFMPLFLEATTWVVIPQIGEKWSAQCLLRNASQQLGSSWAYSEKHQGDNITNTLVELDWQILFGHYSCVNVDLMKPDECLEKFRCILHF